MGQKNGLHAFGYDSAENEPIWMNLEQCEPNVGDDPCRFWALSE